MIKIICVGKMKKEFKAIADDYLRRINRYHKTEIIEVDDKGLVYEKDAILRKIKKDDNVFILDKEGKTYSSTDFSKLIEKELATCSNLTFIVGGSDGLDDQLKKDKKISFSTLTFPHQLFRIILLEQVYRGFKIMKNETYHK